MSDYISLLLTFSRLTTSLVFAVSVIGKITNIVAFQETIRKFKLLPKQISGISAILFIGGEGFVIALLIIGGDWLNYGFLLAMLLLIVFSLALASVMLRKIKTSCNCFGPTTKPVTPYDLVRNAGFILCAFIGWSISNQWQNPSLVEWLLTSFFSIVFVMLWLRLRDIFEFLQAY